jgi:hypothetical protein
VPSPRTSCRAQTELTNPPLPFPPNQRGFRVVLRASIAPSRIVTAFTERVLWNIPRTLERMPFAKRSIANNANAQRSRSGITSSIWPVVVPNRSGRRPVGRMAGTRSSPWPISRRMPAARLRARRRSCCRRYYILKRWESFTLFFEEGRVCLSNNAAGRGLRGIALGRKSWLVDLIVADIAPRPCIASSSRPR